MRDRAVFICWIHDMLNNVHRRSIRGFRQLCGLPSRYCFYGGRRIILVNMHELFSWKFSMGGL